MKFHQKYRFFLDIWLLEFSRKKNSQFIFSTFSFSYPQLGLSNPPSQPKAIKSRRNKQANGKFTWIHNTSFSVAINYNLFSPLRLLKKFPPPSRGKSELKKLMTTDVSIMLKSIKKDLGRNNEVDGGGEQHNFVIPLATRYTHEKFVSIKKFIVSTRLKWGEDLELQPLNDFTYFEALNAFWVITYYLFFRSWSFRWWKLLREMKTYCETSKQNRVYLIKNIFFSFSRQWAPSV